LWFISEREFGDSRLLKWNKALDKGNRAFMRHTGVIIITIALILFSAISAAGDDYYNPKTGGGRPLPKAVVDEMPNFGIEVHKINQMQLAVSNGGNFGIGFAGNMIDPETGMPAPSCEYPAESDVTYLYFGALWAGAVVGRDTLVSIGIADWYDVREFWPLPGEQGAIKRLSNMKHSIDYSPDAVSEQDFISAYTDTFTESGLTGEDPFDNRPHIPLGLELTQRSYAWSYEYAEDFIIFDFTIRNINRFPLKQTYFAIYVDADVYHQSNSGGTNYTDDICGYLHDFPSPNAPGFLDTVRIAWTADNDGDPNALEGNILDYSSATSVTGTAILRAPSPDLKYSFNWWITNYGNPALDWGPRMAGTEERPFRSFGTRLGSPRGDRNKYYVMSSNEFDYGQLESALSHTSAGWMEPSRDAADFADGFDARYLFSFGPFDLQPGDTLPITLAYVAGADFHQDGRDFIDFWDHLNPSQYINQLDFLDLGQNALWAHWIFDNPGYDTPTEDFPEGDGDSGSYHWIVDTISLVIVPDGPDSLIVDSTKYWYRGDGVPDFRGAAPPPAPIIRVIPEFGRLRVQWNGKSSEEFLDVFSHLKDFEGYRVYIGEDNRESDWVLLAAYDRDDYNIHHFDSKMQRWEISLTPVLRDSIYVLFGADLDPLLYTGPQDSYFKNGIAYYFTPQDWNQHNLSNPRGIHRIYPKADLKDPGDTTASGYHRYYEYEYIIENLQPSIPYYVSVTAFDYGSRQHELSSLETAQNTNAVLAYPLASVETVEEKALNVGVYPNPYRIDAGYARIGYENRDRTKSAERARAINFFNLPKICTIRIFSIDGDLIQEIKHYRPDGDPDSQIEKWNLISRNTQAVVTGIYLYHVSSEFGDQLGKIVIIK
jgi:hypothetical protein